MAWKNLENDLEEEFSGQSIRHFASDFVLPKEDLEQEKALRALGGKCLRCSAHIENPKRGRRSFYCVPCRDKVQFEKTQQSLSKQLELEKKGIKTLLIDAGQKHGVTLEELFDRDRSSRIINARKEAWRQLRDMGWSYPDIGKLFDRDHSTVFRVLHPTPTSHRKTCNSGNIRPAA